MAKRRNQKDRKRKESKGKIRIAHWCSNIEATSGMHRMALELHLTDQKVLGDEFETGVVDTDTKNKEGVKYSDPLYSVMSKPWSWALEDQDNTIHVVHSHVPMQLNELKIKIIPLHGTPEHCLAHELTTAHNPLETSVNMIKICNAAITFIPRHLPIWQEFTEVPDKVRLIPNGVSLDFWNLNGNRAMEKDKSGKETDPNKFNYPVGLIGDPSITYFEIWREIKHPMTLMVAMKRFWREVGASRLHLFCIPAGLVQFWTQIRATMNLIPYNLTFQSGHIKDPDVFYRASDMLVSPVIGGDPSRVAMEARACGTSVIGFQGNGGLYHNRQALTYDAVDLTQKMLDEWHYIQDKGLEKVREENWKFARKHLDMKDTVLKLKELYFELIENKGKIR